MAGDRLVQDIRDTEVQKSNKDIELRKTWNERIEEYYKQAKKILEDVQKTWDKELYWKFAKEYNELYNTIKRSIATEKKISIKERNEINKEYNDMINLQSQKSLEIWTKKIFHKGKSTLDETVEQAKQYALNLEEKWIWVFINNEWLTLLVLENIGINTEKIKQKIKSEWYKEKVKLEITYIFKAHKIWDRWLNQLQEKLIDKILWAWSFEKGFGKWSIIWYNNEKWNYIQTVNSFESELKNKNIKDINSIAFAHYISYKNNFSDSEIIKIFWVDNLVDLNEIWSEKSDENKIALEILKAKGLNEKINKIKVIGDKLKNLKWIELLKYIKNLDSVDTIWISIILLKQNYKNIFTEMKNYLRTEIKDEKKAGEIVEKLKNMKSKLDIKAIINTLKEYKLSWKQVKELIGRTLEAWETEEKIVYLKVKQDYNTFKKELWNKEEIEAAEKKLRESEQKLYQAEIQYKKNKTIISKLTDEDIKEVSEKWNLEEIIEKKRKEDKKFDAQLKQYEEQEEVLNLKYEKNTEQKPQTILKESYYTDKTTGATFTRTWANWYTFEWKNWESWEKVSIPISIEEALQVVWKKEAQENLVHFYNTLSELRLTQIWSYRSDIFTAIGNKLWGMEFKTQDNDYLNNNEVAFFLKYIAYSVKDSKTFEKNNQKKSLCKNIIDHENDLKKIENDIKTINNAWTLKTWESEAGKSILEQAFYDKFLTVDWKAWSAESNVNNLVAKFTKAIS